MTIAYQLVLLSICLTEVLGDNWNRQRDDLAEYLLDRSVGPLRGETECLTMVELRHQAVQFDSSNSACRMYICQLGSSGCRKCRNARNASLPTLFVRPLDQLGRACWRTFQHRVDDSVDFYRNWIDYVAGFGQDENRNFWMGLDAIWQLSQAADRRVRWEMSLWNESKYWWENQYFAVQSAGTGYRVTIGSQDVFSNSNIQLTDFVINNQMFSTPDKDQDNNPGSCAILFHSSWWHNSCHRFNPNGQYFTPPIALNAPFGVGLSFESDTKVYPFVHSHSMKNFECMIADVLRV